MTGLHPRRADDRPPGPLLRGRRSGVQRHGLVPAGDPRLLPSPATHAPELVWLAGAIGLEAAPDQGAGEHARGAAVARRLDVRRAVRRLLELRPQRALVDEVLRRCRPARPLRNANNSVIGGSYHRPKVRLPGTAGLGDMGSIGSAPLLLEPQPQPSGAGRTRSTSSRAPATSAAATSASASGSRAARSWW